MPARRKLEKMSEKNKGGRPRGRLNDKTIARRALVTACLTDDEEAFLRAIMTSDSELVTLRDRIDCAKALLTARRFAKEEKPDPRLIEGEQTTYGPGEDPLLIPRSIPTRHD
jgi:hypothetical protein